MLCVRERESFFYGQDVLIYKSGDVHCVDEVWHFLLFMLGFLLSEDDDLMGCIEE